MLGGLAVLTVVGPFAFVHGFNRVAGTNTYGPVSPIEALGVWPASNYRLNAVGGAQLTGLATAIAALAVLARRRLVAAPPRLRRAGRARRLHRPLPRRARRAAASTPRPRR